MRSFHAGRTLFRDALADCVFLHEWICPLLERFADHDAEYPVCPAEGPTVSRARPKGEPPLARPGVAGAWPRCERDIFRSSLRHRTPLQNSKFGGPQREHTRVVLATFVCRAFPMPAALGAVQHPRHVYLDLGMNWGDTLDLYRLGLADAAHANATDWEVYGFEAAPLLMPYLEQLVQWKNGEPGVAHPVTCEPPVGSTKDRMRFAPVVGCWRSWGPKMNFCMDHVFHNANAHTRPDMELLNHSRVVARLREAHDRPSAAATSSATGARYTFVPAAVGGNKGTLSFNRNRVSLGEGSKMSSGSVHHMASGAGDSSGHSVDVQIVGTLASWATTSPVESLPVCSSVLLSRTKVSSLLCHRRSLRLAHAEL